MKEFMNMIDYILVISLGINAVVFFTAYIRKGKPVFMNLFWIFIFALLDDILLKVLNGFKIGNGDNPFNKYIFCLILSVNFMKIVSINLGFKNEFDIKVRKEEVRSFFLICGIIIVVTSISHTIIAEIIGYVVINICLIKTLSKLLGGVFRKMEKENHLKYNVFRKYAAVGVVFSGVAIIEDILFALSHNVLSVYPENIHYSNMGAQGLKFLLCTFSISLLFYKIKNMVSYS